MTDEQFLTTKVEALIMASPEPLPVRRIVSVLEDLTPSRAARSVADLNTAYAASGSSFRIREIAGGYQFYILPDYEGVVESLFTKRRQSRLSRAALETVAVVAYRQPTTKMDIEHIRGVASDGVLHTLLEKGLIRISGRADTVGKPLQYGTTDEFLKYFGLARIEDLPKMSEIEEMIAAQEPRRQTELEFGVDDQGRLMKLNIIDGTFDPVRRQRLEDGIPEGVETTSEENVAEIASRIVLKRSSESTESPDDQLDKEDHSEVTGQPAATGTSEA
jgi:segregation and condensation protein B